MLAIIPVNSGIGSYDFSKWKASWENEVVMQIEMVMHIN